MSAIKAASLTPQNTGSAPMSVVVSPGGEKTGRAKFQQNRLGTLPDLPLFSTGQQSRTSSKTQYGRAPYTLRLNPELQTSEKPKAVKARTIKLPAGSVEEVLHLLIEKHRTGRLLYNPAGIRNADYQAVVEELLENDTVRKILPEVQKSLLAKEESRRQAQIASEGLVLNTRTMELAVAQPYAKKLFGIAQKVSRAYGFAKAPTLVMTPAVSPNAMVYTADKENPWITFYTPLIDKLWDYGREDWIKIYLDAQGKPVEAGTPGSREIPVGELMIESVMAHELGHVRDQVILYDSLIMTLFIMEGTNVIEDAIDSDRAKDAEKAMQKLIARFEGPSHQSNKGTIGDRCHHLVGAQGAVLQTAKEVAAKVSLERTEIRQALQQLSSKLTAKPSSQKTFSGGLDDLLDLADDLMALSRAAEGTADRYPSLLQRTADWNALTEAMFGIDLGAEVSDEEKIRSIERLILMNPERWAKLMVDEMEDASSPEVLHAFNDSRSHPAPTVRVQHHYAFVRDPHSYFAKMQAFNALEPELRVLAVLQLYGAEVEALNSNIAKSKAYDQFHLLPKTVAKQQMKAELSKYREEMSSFQALMDRQIRAEDILRIRKGYIDAALDFIEGGGSSLVQSETAFRSVLEVELNRSGFHPIAPARGVPI